MTFNDTQIKALQAPLDSSKVKNREQGGTSLSYVEGWHVIAEANRIFGFDGWHRETILLQETNRDLVTLKGRNDSTYEQWRIGYIAKVKITVGGIVREGTGYGSGMGKPEAVGDAVEGAIKEAETDAMKRALMTFGNPFGLALYDKTKANVIDADQQAAIDKAEAAITTATAAINSAATIEAAQAAFGPAWKAMATADQQARLKATYDARKAALTAPADDDFPGEDNAQQQAAE